MTTPARSALTFFHAHAAYLEKAMPVGEHVVVSGRMEWFNGRPTMVHPDHIALASEAENLPLVEPVYPLTAGLSGKVLRRAIGQALGRLPELPEWQDGAFMRRQTFPGLRRRARPHPLSGRPDRCRHRGRGMAAARL